MGVELVRGGLCHRRSACCASRRCGQRRERASTAVPRAHPRKVMKAIPAYAAPRLCIAAAAADDPPWIVPPPSTWASRCVVLPDTASRRSHRSARPRWINLGVCHRGSVQTRMITRTVVVPVHGSLRVTHPGHLFLEGGRAYAPLPDHHCWWLGDIGREAFADLRYRSHRRQYRARRTWTSGPAVARSTASGARDRNSSKSAGEQRCQLRRTAST